MIYGYDGNDPRMTENTPLLAGQIVVMACLSLFAAIAIVGGALQFFLGQPDTSPRLDNVQVTRSRIDWTNDRSILRWPAATGAARRERGRKRCRSMGLLIR